MLNDRNDPDMHLNSNILFLASWYPTRDNPTHGIFIQNHARALALHTPVTVVYAYSSAAVASHQIETKTTGNLTEVLLPYRKTKTRIPILKQYLQFKNYRAAYQTLLHFLIEKRISVAAIQVNVAFPVAMVLPIFKNHYQVKHTLVEHWSGYLPEDGNYKGFILKLFTRACFENVSKVWYVSQLQKQSMLAHGLTGDYELLYNAVDTTIFKPLAKSKNTTTTLLHISSLVEREKNLKGTFEALKILQNKNLSFELIIIGGDQQSIEVAKNLQNSIGLKNVTYKGYQPKEIISEYMNVCHALLLFSHFEGMPVVVLEALACGLPVFASSVGQLPQMISSDFGKLAEKNKVADFASLLENHLNGRYQFSSENMREFVLKHASYEAVGKQLFDFYSK